MLADVIANAKNYERTLIKKGEQAGIVKGRAEGEQAGIVKGKAEGAKARDIEIAKKMLAKNKPISEIMEFTDLTEQEILDIGKD